MSYLVALAWPLVALMVAIASLLVWIRTVARESQLLVLERRVNVVLDAEKLATAAAEQARHEALAAVREVAELRTRVSRLEMARGLVRAG